MTAKPIELAVDRVVHDAPVRIPIEDLAPHPDNPRIAPREDTVDQILAAIRAGGGFDPAHAPIVRPIGRGYQIVSGHHRVEAARRAGLPEVPCWVRDLDDEDAFMMLVTTNAQSELSALERGLHALKAAEARGLSVAAYVEGTAWSRESAQKQIQAARVAASPGPSVPTAELQPDARHLAEVHAAPRWLWPAAVARLVAEGWTVEATRRSVEAPKDMPEPPGWADAAAIAGALVNREVTKADVARLGPTVEQAAARLASDDLRAELFTGLAAARPAALSAVQEICRSAAERSAEVERERCLSLRVFNDYRAIVDACCQAWNRLAAAPDRLRSLSDQPWIRKVISQARWYH